MERRVERVLVPVWDTARTVYIVVVVSDLF
jgi:hypothetical protein